MSELEVLMNRLEDLVEESKKIPMTNSIKVDKAEIEEIIYEMRVNIPKSIKEAESVVFECNEYLEHAQKEAKQIIEQAEMEATKLVSDHEVYIRAVDKAEELSVTTNQELNDAVMEAMLAVDSILEKTGDQIHILTNSLNDVTERARKTMQESTESILNMRKDLRD